MKQAQKDTKIYKSSKIKKQLEVQRAMAWSKVWNIDNKRCTVL
jgi:hypothetical protein